MLSYIKSSAKDSIIYGFGSIGVKFAGLVLIPIYTSNFSIFEYGLLGFLEATSLAIIALCGLSLYNAFYIFYWDNNYIEKQKSIFFTILVVLITFTSAITIIVILNSQIISLRLLSNTKYNSLIKFLIYASSLQIISNIPTKLLQLQSKAAIYTISNLLMIAVNITSTIILIEYFKQGISSIYISQIISTIFYLVILLPFIIKNSIARIEIDILIKMLRFSFPLIIATISGLIISISDRYLLKFLAGYSDLGLYSFGSKLANTVNVILIAPIQMAINPILIRLFNTDKNSRFYVKSMTYLGFLVLFFILLFSFFSFELVKIVARKKEYWDSTIIIPLLSFGYIFAFMKDFAVLHLQLIKKTRIISIIIITISVINVSLNMILINLFGYVGASLSFILSQLMYFILMHYFANKYGIVGYEYIKVIKMISIGVVLIILIMIFNNYSFAIRLLVKVLLLMLFPIALLTTNFFEKVEKAAIKSILITWSNPINWWKNIQRILQ
jgi:O-antigen/teichoic acid export membrane protein